MCSLISPFAVHLTLLMLNKLRCHAHFQFPANQITWSEFLIDIHIFNDKLQIQISWLLKNPTDLDLHCLLRQGKRRVNLYHSVGKLSRPKTNSSFSNLPRKCTLTFYANCLLRRQFVWNVKSHFLGKIFQNVFCWNFYPAYYSRHIFSWP